MPLPGLPSSVYFRCVLPGEAKRVRLQLVGTYPRF